MKWTPTNKNNYLVKNLDRFLLTRFSMPQRLENF